MSPHSGESPTAEAPPTLANASSGGFGRRALRRTAGVLESEGLPSAANAVLSLAGYRPAEAAAAAPAAEEVPAEAAEEEDEGGTACRCICGDRAVWHRALFRGDVEKEKERECREEICPHLMIPGLRIHAECNYAKKTTDLTAGTLCNCNCGEQITWRNRGFYGNVTEEKEKECLEELCPMVNPVPGLVFRAHCTYDENLFAMPKPREPVKSKAPAEQLRGIIAVLVGMGCLITCSLILGSGIDDDESDGGGPRWPP